MARTAKPKKPAGSRKKPSPRAPDGAAQTPSRKASRGSHASSAGNKSPAAGSPDSTTASKPRQRKPERFPIVTIGASAGGLSALKKFLSSVPRSCGMAFVLIPHLDPTHESLMVELLAKQTSMPVREAAHRMRVEPDHVYVIPPNKYLAVKAGALMLSKPPGPRGLETVIDFALRSLAEDQKDAAIGIILSGTGSHGTLGIKEIKLAGGLVLVQDPDTAEFDQMPRSAISTGVVDYVLPPEKMPDALMRYVREAHPDRERAGGGAEAHEDGLRRILALLQTRARYDFRFYRKNTVLRRIQRRMALLQLRDLGDYLEHLRKHSDEVAALRKDLLIGVTTFFRDPEAFTVLAEKVLPKLVDRADAEAPVRVWIPGCATGEEAYSIAILLIEQFRAVEKAVNIQMFATDIDEDSLATARQGIFPSAIAEAVSPERLQRFFVKMDKHHYQVGKQLRDLIVFAPQNLIGDAPFSKLDLISCRNLLIYLEPEVQQKIISLLHFALKEEGYLLLGPSETIGRATAMFEPISKKWRLYRRIGPVRRELVSIPIVASDLHTPTIAPEPKPRRRADFTQAMQRLLLEDFAPASALINREYEILSVLGPLVNYLEFPPGEISRNLLAMARQGLRVKLRASCQQAMREGRTVSSRDVRVRRNGGYVPCTITVRPISEPADMHGLLLVVFQERFEAPAEATAGPESTEEASVVRQLEEELRATRADLQGTIEELETSNEELKASNEEVMSMNEELQSTNEELETSKEELQSLNEELTTVNSQLQDKVEELDSANSDLTNLMAATEIATVFLDTDLCIKRFTQPTARLLNLIATDLGRPIRDLAPRFKDDKLLDDARRVMDTLTPLEKTVHTDEKHWYLRRIQPYRAGDSRIGGVVITLVDITARVEAEAQARRMAAALRDSNDAVIVSNFDGRITGWNKGAEHMYGYSEADALEMNIRDLAPKELKNDVLDLGRRVAAGEDVDSFDSKRVARDGRVVEVWMTAAALRDENGVPVAMATTERDVTMRRQAEAEIRKLNETLERRIAQRTAELEASEYRSRTVLDATVDAIITIDQVGVIQTFNAAAERIFGYPAAEAVGRNVKMLMPPPYRQQHDGYLARYVQGGEPHLIGKTRELKGQRKDGTVFPLQLSVNPIEHLRLFTGIIRDITDQKALQEEIVRCATMEQHRIGEELHDSTQQELTGLGMLAENLSDALEAAGASRELGLARRLAAGIAEANRQVQAIARGMVPEPVNAKRLTSSLKELAKKTEELHGLKCRFETSGHVKVDNDVAAMHLYRIAQEAITNAVRHSKADTLNVRLLGSPGQLRLEIRDNGIGVDNPARSPGGLGLRVMEHRCALVGGALTVRKQESGGTAVVCVVPMTPGA